MPPSQQATAASRFIVGQPDSFDGCTGVAGSRYSNTDHHSWAADTAVVPALAPVGECACMPWALVPAGVTALRQLAYCSAQAAARASPSGAPLIFTGQRFEKACLHTAYCSHPQSHDAHGMHAPVVLPCCMIIHENNAPGTTRMYPCASQMPEMFVDIGRMRWLSHV